MIIRTPRIPLSTWAVLLGMLSGFSFAQEPRPVIVEIDDLRFTAQPGDEGPHDSGVGTPFLIVVFHDGSLDFFDKGKPADDVIGAFASEGLLDGIQAKVNEHGAAFWSAMVLPNNFAGRLDATNAIYGFGYAPPIVDPTRHKFVSFLARLYPSDDAFVGNDDPRRYRLFDDAGTFIGPVVFDVYGDDVLDAGVQVNDELDLIWLDRTHFEPRQEWQPTEALAIRSHPGFHGSRTLPDGKPVRILAGSTFLHEDDDSPRVLYHIRYDPLLADFKRPGSALMRFKITSGIHQGMAGSYFSVARTGEGAFFEVLGDGQGGELLGMSFYTYEPDGSGKQVYLVGAGQVEYNVANIDLYRTEGGAFASESNPENVERPFWGRVSVRFDGPQCTNAQIDVLETADPAWFLDESYVLQRSGLLTPGARSLCGSKMLPVLF